MNFMPWLLYTKGKSTVTLLLGALLGPRVNLWEAVMLWGREKSLSLPGIGPQFHSHPFHILVTILTGCVLFIPGCYSLTFLSCQLDWSVPTYV
jgi:hypothetical protein